MAEDYAQVNGIKICYEIKGEGYPVLLVIGFGGKKEDWIAQFDELSKYFKVIRFDNRGSGKSDRPTELYSIEAFVEDTKALMEYLSIDKAHIIGWSLGGMIVQNFALTYPEKVNKIVLIATNYGFREGAVDWYKEMSLENLKKRDTNPEKYFWDGALSGFYPTFRKEMQANPKKKFFGLWSVEDLIKESTINPPTSEDIELQAHAIKTHNTRERLSQIKNETLLISPSHDRSLPKAHMYEMDEKMQNSTLISINKAGHNVPLSRAPEVNKLIIDFLKR